MGYQFLMFSLLRPSLELVYLFKIYEKRCCRLVGGHPMVLVEAMLFCAAFFIEYPRTHQNHIDSNKNKLKNIKILY